MTPDTTELARRLYEKWRARKDLLQPAADDLGPVRNHEGHLVSPRRDHPRPKWEHLDTIQQGIWREVAIEATKALGNAMGVL